MTIESRAARPGVVVVTGLPGSGKTTLGRALAVELEVPLFSLDAIKEALYDAPGGTDRTRGELRFSAESVLAVLLADTRPGAVLDIWLDPARDDRARLRASLPPGVATVEVRCEVPADVAVRRYAERLRYGAHLGLDADLERRIRGAATLLGAGGSGDLGPVVRVDTAREVVIADLIDGIGRILTG